MNNNLELTPWDAKIFGLTTYEIIYQSDRQFEELINEIKKTQQTGHYTVKIHPTESKVSLHKLGFYYCDSLIEPFCLRENFIEHSNKNVSFSQDMEFDAIKDICLNTFDFGRFQRYFNVSRRHADQRYINWLEELWKKKQVLTLLYQTEIAGFFAFSQNKILLHALRKKFRGRGLSKFFWSQACQYLFEQKFSELTSSISACNLPVLNLYVSLGFKFRNPVDVYHWLFED